MLSHVALDQRHVCFNVWNIFPPSLSLTARWTVWWAMTLFVGSFIVCNPCISWCFIIYHIQHHNIWSGFRFFYWLNPLTLFIPGVSENMSVHRTNFAGPDKVLSKLFDQARNSIFSICTCNHKVVVFYDTSSLVIFPHNKGPVSYIVVNDKWYNKRIFFWDTLYIKLLTIDENQWDRLFIYSMLFLLLRYKRLWINPYLLILIHHFICYS